MAEKKAPAKRRTASAVAEAEAPTTRKVYRHSRYPNHLIAGVGKFVGGVLALDDPELQEKLETHPGFGRDIKLIGTDLPVPTVDKAHEVPVPEGSTGLRSSQQGGRVIVGAVGTDDLGV